MREHGLSYTNASSNSTYFQRNHMKRNDVYFRWVVNVFSSGGLFHNQLVYFFLCVFNTLKLLTHSFAIHTIHRYTHTHTQTYTWSYMLKAIRIKVNKQTDRHSHIQRTKNCTLTRPKSASLRLVMRNLLLCQLVCDYFSSEFQWILFSWKKICSLFFFFVRLI